MMSKSVNLKIALVTSLLRTMIGTTAQKLEMDKKPFPSIVAL